MSKKRKNQKKSKKTNFTKVFLIIFLFSFLAFFLSYMLINKEKTQNPSNKKIERIPSVKEKENNFTFEKIIQHKEEIKKPEKIIEPQYEEKLPEKEVHIQKEEKPVIISKKPPYRYDKRTKGKLAIVIDDVSYESQKRAILNIGYKVGMAFLPPTKGHRNSAKIAQDLPFYIIHFPMQASPKFKGEEEKTLHINDSYEKIEKRVKQLRAWYPKATYTNNHTGSVFTQNDEAMDKLFKALKKYNFTFIDSKTTPKSVGKKYAKKYNMPYIVRDTFLDNKKEYNYIKKQLIKAINKAKKDGYAIAIGHPHHMTLKVLKESKYLLKDLELIYINELPYLN